MPYKNTAITVCIMAWDTANSTGKTGDSANITVRGVGDGSEFTPAAPSITEIDSTNLKGVYSVALAAGENNYSFVLLGGKSSTASIIIQPISWTNESSADVQKFGGSAGTFSGGLPDVNTKKVNGTSQTAADLGSVVNAIKTVTDKFVFTIANVVDANITTAASFAQVAADKVWSTTTRLLTAGTNIALAKGVGVTGFNDVSASDVNAEVVDALNVDTYAEPGQESPGATVSLSKKISYLYKAWRNRTAQNATTYKLYNDDAATVDQKATTSDDGTTAERTEITTGP